VAAGASAFAGSGAFASSAANERLEEDIIQSVAATDAKIFLHLPRFIFPSPLAVN
jgi:hypothetical protein